MPNENEQGTNAYQRNISQTEPVPQQRQLSTGQILADINTIAQFDPERANEFSQQFAAEQQRKGSPYYNPYTQPTNKAFGYMKQLGVDMSGFNNDSWFTQNAGMKDWFAESANTNNAKAPTKKSSTQERIGYNYNELYKAKDRTSKALLEEDALWQEIQHWVAMDNLNLSDDEIMGKIDWSKYSTLRDARDSAAQGQPIELNAPLTLWNDDSIKAAIWMARNPDDESDIWGAMAKSATRQGNQWHYDESIANKLSPSITGPDGTEITNPDFHPYSVGCTNLEQESLYFGMKWFSPEWVEANAWRTNSKDKTEATMMSHVIEAYEDQKEVDKERAELEAFIANKAKTAKNVQAIMDSIDWNKYPMLVKLDKSIGQHGYNMSGNLVALTSGTDYSFNGIEELAQSAFDERMKLKTEDDSAIKMSGTFDRLANPPRQRDRTAKGTMSVQQTGHQRDRTATGTMEIPQAGSGQETADVPTGEQRAEEMAPAGEPEGIVPAVGTPEQEEPVQTAAPAEKNPFPVLTEQQKEAVRIKNQKALDSVPAIENVASESELDAIENTGEQTYSLFDMFKAAGTVYGGMLIREMGWDDSKQIANRFIGDSLGVVKDIAVYQDKQKVYDEGNAKMDEYREKYGDLDDINGEIQPGIVREMNDGLVQVSLFYNEKTKRYDVASIDTPGYEYERDIKNSSDPYSVGLMNSAKQMAVEETTKAKRIQDAHDRVAAGGEQAKADVAEYGALKYDVDNAKEYIDSHADEYAKQAQDLQSWQAAMGTSIASMKLLGMDTTELEQAYAVSERLSYYLDEPPLPLKTETNIQSLDNMLGSYGVEWTNERKTKWLDDRAAEKQKDLDINKMLLDYIEEAGLEVPDSIIKNIQYTIEDIQRDLDDIKWSKTMLDASPEEVEKAVAAGKAFEEKYREQDGMNTWDVMYGADKTVDYYHTLREKQAYMYEDSYYTVQDENGNEVRVETIDPEEEKTYYYLLGRKVLELGDEFDRLWNRPDGRIDPKAGEVLDEIMKDGNDYIAFMDNDDYGAWVMRSSRSNSERLKRMVDSGFMGGLVSNVGATVSTPIEFVANAFYSLDRLLTGKRINPNSRLLTTANAKKAIRAATNESIDNVYGKDSFAAKLAHLGYEIYCNRGDSYMNSLTFGMFNPFGDGILGNIAGATPMGITAAMNAAAEAVTNGANTEQAWLIAGATLIAETATEGLTYGNIRKALNTQGELSSESIRAFIKEWLTESGRDEAIGESATEWFENFIDEKVMQENSNHERLVRELYSQGHTKEGEAETLARQQEVKNVLRVALVSYLSAGTDVITKTGRAAINGFNYYRAATKADQRLGGSDSMIDKMLDSWRGKNGIQAPVITAPTASRQAETATEAQETGKPAQPVHQRNRTASEEQTMEIAPAEQAESAEEETAEGEMTVDSAEQTTGTEEESKPSQPRHQRNRAAAEGEMTIGSSGQEESTAASESAPATENQQAIAKDIVTVNSTLDSNASSQTAAIASALTGGAEEAQRDVGFAAAMSAKRVMGNNANVMIAEIMQGAAEQDVQQSSVQNAISIALLGNGEATALVQSDEFRNASATRKVDMLMEAAVRDMENPQTSENMSRSVVDARRSMAFAQLARDGHFDQAIADKEAANKAAKATMDAKDQLEQREAAEEAAGQRVQAAGEAVMQDPGDHANVDEFNSATSEQQKRAEESEQYRQHEAKMEEAQKEAEEKAEKSAEEATNSAREIADQQIQQEDADRQAVKDAQAEQERQEAEAMAQAQAEEDERSGKAQEERENAAIDQAVDGENLEGVEAENRRDALKEQRDKVKIKLRDLSKPVTNAEGMLALYAFERKLGIKINLEDMGKVTKQGWVRGKYSNGVITLNKNMTLGQALVEAALHEIPHYMRNTNSYKAYRDVVMRSVFGETGDVNNLYESNDGFRAKVDATIAERISAGDKNFVGKSHQEQIAAAEDEIVADFARLNLAEKDVVQRFMDNGLGGRMRNTLHNINQALKNYFSNMSGEERQQAEYFRKAERAFQKAMNEAARKSEHPEGGQFSIMQIAQATGMTFNEETLQLFDQDGNEIDGVDRKITPEMIVNTPVGMLIDNGLTGEQNVKAKEMMAGLMNMVARYKDSNLVWEIGATTLSSTFSALKSNSDPQYKTTVDFGTVCAKTQAIIDTLSQVMLDKVKEGEYGGLNRKDIMKVYDAVNKAGLSVPCPVCYVFSRWMGVPSLLGQMSQYQHNYVVTNEDGSINKQATQEKVNAYIAKAESEYGDAKAINSQKTKLQNKQTNLEERRVTLERELRTASEDQKEAKQAEIDSVLDQLVEVDQKLGEVNAYNWITQALCKKDKNGNYVVDDKFQLTPDEILFDLNRTGEFAGYEKNWRYRNTRGAGMGKAIMPYSGETIGDVLYGVKKGGRLSSIRNPWLNMDENSAARQLRDARNRAAKQNLVGGQRLQSTSDFRPEWGLDYIMSFLELQAAGSKVQMYTKVAEAVDFFASVGADVNLSIMGKGQGWHVDENGNYVLDFSSVTGMDYETAKALKDKYDNVQMILVGMNDTHIRLALANSDIDFVIPWHSSGNSKDVISGLMSTFKENLDNGHNYEDSQNDTFAENRTDEQKALWDARMKLLTKGGNTLTEAERMTLLSNPVTADLYKRFTQKGVDDDCYNVKLSKEQAKQIFPYEYWDTSLTKDQADQNGKRFVEYCEAMGIVPRFSQFKDDTGYWKLLIDRPMYNNDGTYHQQQVIDVTNARIGDLNESGQLEGSDLPTQAQAKYAPKDPRNPNYEKYTEAQKQAVENAEAAINERYDDGSEGQLSVYGEMTEADRQMMQEAEQDRQNVLERGDTEAAQQDEEYLNSQDADEQDSELGEPIDNEQLSTSGELSEVDQSLANEAEINQSLVNAGVLSQEEADAYLAQMGADNGNNLPGAPGMGPQRQFGHQTSQTSDALHQEVKDYLYNHSTYTPDTNEEQINRAMGWVQSMARTSDEDGYHAALDEVTSDNFDYRSADGQARMLTVMSMAALKGDMNAELRLADAFNKQGTDLGRQLQARKIFRLMTPVGRQSVLTNMADELDTDLRNRGYTGEPIHLSEWILRAAGAAQSEEDFHKVQQAAQQELAEQVPPTWKDKLQTWRMLSMLANPRTHIRNIVGNALFVPTVGIKNKIAAGLESAFIKDGERTKAFRFTDDAKAFAAQDVIAMRDTLTGEAKYSPDDKIKQNQKVFGTKNGILSRTVGRFVQGASDLNSNLLEGEDWLFLNGHYQRALAGYMTANGLTSEQMTGDTLDKARNYAVLEAQKATYRDANAISSWLNDLSRQGGAKGFIVDTVLPFKKTPANILRRGVEYSPVGLLYQCATAKKSLDLYDAWVQNGRKGDMPKGAKSANQVIDSIAAGLTGTGIAALGAFLSSIGAVKLSFGKEPDDELEKERRSQEYSVEIELFGHKFSETVDWAAPACMPFFTGASIYQDIANGGSIKDVGDAAGLFGRVLNGLSAISEPVFNLSMLDGVSSLLSTSSYSQGNVPIFEIGQNIGANYIGSMWPSVFGAAARTIDRTQRKSYVESGDPLRIWKQKIEQTQNKIPFLSQYNIPYRNVWGETSESGVLEAILENFVLPGYHTEIKSDAVIDELQRHYDQNQDSSVIPKAASKTINGYKMNDKEYDRYVTVRGQTAKQVLDELFSRDEYKILNETNPEGQAEMIANVWKYANALARLEIIPDSEVDKWILDAQANGNPVDAVITKLEAKAQKAEYESHRDDLFTSIDDQNADGIGTHIEGLRRAGKDDKAIKQMLTTQYRKAYMKAVVESDYETMEAIRYGLLYADVGYDEKSFDKWEKDAWKE